MRLEVILPGLPDEDIGSAPALVLDEPISFWGGISPVSGLLTDPRSRHHNRPVAGAALFVRELRGSSSGSSVLLELIHRGLAPAAIILDSPDAILAVGAIVGREMGWKSPRSCACLPRSRDTYRMARWSPSPGTVISTSIPPHDAETSGRRDRLGTEPQPNCLRTSS